MHPSQAGVYRCTTSSAVGTAVAQATLNVHEAPMMTVRPPSEIVVAVGESANLDCFVVSLILGNLFPFLRIQL